MEMSLTDMLPLFTNKIVAKYADNTKFKSFGRSLFTEVATNSKLASVLSQRGYKLISTDTQRGGRGNLNVFDKSTQKNVLPPYFNEMINLTELDSYDYLFAGFNGIASEVAWGNFIDDLAKRMEFIMNKIDGAYEKMCWDYLLTGIVTLVNDDSISYGRQAGSLVDPGAGNYWANAIDPYTTTFDRGATFLNETGKMAGNTINVIFGQQAWKDYQGNASVKARNLQYNNNLEVLANKALIDSTGKIFKGATTIGAFNYQFWMYAEWWEDGAGAKTRFVDNKKIIMLPDEFPATLTYTAVPQRLKPGQTPVASKFLTYTANDEMQDAEYTGVKSAGVPIPGGIDQVYTEKVVA